jgi:Fur family ferric uptake transcriptional regulator
MKRPSAGRRPTPPRDTRQRRAIRHVLDVADRPLSPPEVLGHARAAVPGLGLATVYRTLNALVGEGWLVPVEIPGRPPRYERAGKAHHHHFQCRGCGGVYEVHGCPGNMRALTPAGFRLEGHELVLYGVCRDCRGTGSGRV